MPDTQDNQPAARRPACIQLDAMTLRGIGPYFHEARLDIAPVTILCGENGSGKSTWFKILKLLAKANDRRIGKQFPPFFPKRLLALNHERAAQEAASTMPPQKKRGKSKADETDGGLFE